MHIAGVIMPILVFEDLQPCMPLRNLRFIFLAIEWVVNLSDSELLTLTSVWPHISSFMSVGAGTRGVEVRQMDCYSSCSPSLNRIALAMDTRGYTIPPSSLGLELALPPKLSLSVNVVDSIIEAESMPAISAFFAGTALQTDLVLHAWERIWRVSCGPLETCTQIIKAALALNAFDEGSWIVGERDGDEGSLAGIDANRSVVATTLHSTT
ncbi:hypothetical protein L210DRAFT_3664767 [Boletus edulis BED1]|uniref:Uncharacterized protein n=1 Tax=Boletus edulis BED1 TaxID=1328754 RepID=A0AAD4GFP6_BOLED|nr:hypothetical protein L210DRAFT_3664767 [Boletus edulis BED1]